MSSPDACAPQIKETATLEKFEVTEQGPILFETLVMVDGVIQSRTLHNQALLASILNKEVPDAVTCHR